jgi:UDP-4-amino-4,6-dideoxy-N-acetyl-beta-L-altrosamine transaminase
MTGVRRKRPIAYGGQTIDREDTRSVLETLVSENLTQGPAVEAFEAALAEYTGARYAVASSSGTAALHMACVAAGFGEGQRVATTPNTFVATPNAVLYTGATPVFVDVDPLTGTMDLERLGEVLDYNIRAAIPVHYGGAPRGMETLGAMATEHGLTVIEDACHALGARWLDSEGREHVVGDCSHSDMTVFSFHPVKSITTGEGGAVTTNDVILARRLREARSHGIVKTPPEGGHWPPWHYEMRSLGFNYRISDIQCALGLSQLGKIESFMTRRREIAALYDELFAPHAGMVSTPSAPPGEESAWHLYPLCIDFQALGIDKESWFEAMLAEGIRLQSHYIPVPLQPYYRRRFGYRRGQYPGAEAFFESEASLPIYPALTDRDVRFVARTVIKTLSGAIRVKEKKAG